ncbi:hypothetical protein ACFYRN_23225 [Streptomyces sp. NPDC005227]|uniref:hypothetical protein n=1 Tax=Streptomyces sp. NPDC005227 TaxID=3364707 RepID=UPI00367FF434
MRITVTQGDSRVEIDIEGYDSAALDAAQSCAAQIVVGLAAAEAGRRKPKGPEGPDEPFGFGLGSDTERLPE